MVAWDVRPVVRAEQAGLTRPKQAGMTMPDGSMITVEDELAIQRLPGKGCLAPSDQLVGVPPDVRMAAIETARSKGYCPGWWRPYKGCARAGEYGRVGHGVMGGDSRLRPCLP
jgi:hypothetical protein